jgi:thiol-disulfide isomerase/thioredoxin
MESKKKPASETTIFSSTVYAAGDPSKTQLSFTSLLGKNEITVVSFLRRFGCPVCRALATGLSYVKKSVFDPMGIQLVAIAIEEVGYEEFRSKNYFTGQIFVNPGGDLFRTLKLKRLSAKNLYGIGSISQMKAAIKLASDTYLTDTMNFDGDYYQLGGFFIFSDYGKTCLYEFKEAYAGDSPLVHKILDVLHAHSEEVANIFPDPDKRVLQLAQEAIKERRKMDRLRQSINEESSRISGSAEDADDDITAYKTPTEEVSKLIFDEASETESLPEAYGYRVAKSVSGESRSKLPSDRKESESGI